MATNTKKRHCQLIIASGVRGVGKSYETFKRILKYIRDNRRKVLIFDVNDEYGKFKPEDDEAKVLTNGKTVIVRSISIDDVPLFSAHNLIQIRRIRPLNPKTIYDKKGNIIVRAGTFMNANQMLESLVNIIYGFRGGLLLIEDISQIFENNISHEIAGLITRVRHLNIDIIMHLQSIAPILPRMWQNVNYTRFHKQIDGIDKSADKLCEKYEIYKIVENMVNYQYNNLGNVHYYLWVDNLSFKIFGNYTTDELKNGIMQYLKQNKSTLKPILNETDDSGKKINDYNKAISIKTNELFKLYHGN